MRRRNAHNKAPNSLGILAVVLILSAFFRLSSQPLWVFAEGAQPQDSTIASDEITVAGIPFSDDAIEAILTALQVRETRLIDREQELIALEAKLNEAERRITEKINELVTVEEKLAGTLALADTAAEDDLSRLATVYENMKPKDTAALFAEMAPGFAAGFLGLMQAEAAAAVMTELEPQAAHTISVMLAGRNANAFMPQ